MLNFLDTAPVLLGGVSACEQKHAVAQAANDTLGDADWAAHGPAAPMNKVKSGELREFIDRRHIATSISSFASPAGSDEGRGRTSTRTRSACADRRRRRAQSIEHAE